jgi:hypothetical protein
MGNTFTKDPQAVLDYKFDWSQWLQSGEVITSHSVAASTGISVDSSSVTDSDTSVTAWLSGGTDVIQYIVTCTITTNAARTDARSILVSIDER